LPTARPTSSRCSAPTSTGLSEDEAIATIALARPLTAEELRQIGKRGSLQSLAEALFGGQIEVAKP
jgi:hypothetical protein